MSRAATLRRVGLLVLGVNALLALLKGLVWLETGSLAVGSEAVNSLADTAYSGVVYAGLYLTTRPPDFEHPHGHERIEPFVSLFVAAGMLVAGGVILWRAVTDVAGGGVAVATGPAAALVLAGSAGAKYLLYRYTLAVSRTVNSPAVAATAVDSRNDVLTAGAALVGVVGAQLGAPVLDPVAAGVVAATVIAAGVGVVRDNVDYLVGAAPAEDLRTDIVRRTLEHPEVEGVHDVVAHYVGPEVDVSLHVEVEGERTLLEAHDIESDVIADIEAIDEVDDAFVHVDPRELGEWKSGRASDPVVRRADRGGPAPGRGADGDDAGTDDAGTDDAGTDDAGTDDADTDHPGGDHAGEDAG